MITTEKKTDITKKFQIHQRDTGSADVQIALLTARINELTGHLQSNVKDHSSAWIAENGRPTTALARLSERTDRERYQELIKKLNLRK